MAPNTPDAFLRAVLDRAPDGVLTECGDRIAYINDAYARILGYSGARELAGATIHDIAHPEDESRLRSLGHQREHGLAAPSRYTFRVRHRDGSAITLDASISATRLGSQFLITTIVREIERVSMVPFAQPGDVARLTDREREVLALTLRGHRPKEIATMLDLSEKTIGTFRTRIFQKLSLRGDADLFRFAAEHHLLEHRETQA